MKDLSTTITDQLALAQGLEPKIVVAIEWQDNKGFIEYSKQTISGVEGTLQDIGSINYTFSDTRVNNATVNVTLYDEKEYLKGLYDSQDLHKRKAYVYQVLPTDRFVIFKGYTNSPIVWNEADRTLTLSLISDVESVEVGFSPEEADYSYISKNAIGRAWPLCFGDVVHVPAVKTRQRPVGTLETKFSVVDPTLYYKSGAILNAYYQEIFFYNYYKSIAQRAEAIAPSVEQIATEYIQIIGLEDENLRAIQQYEDALVKERKNIEDQKMGIQIIAAPIFGIIAGMSLADRRLRVKTLRQYIRQFKKDKKVITDQKKVIEKKIELIEYEISVQKEAFRLQNEAFNNTQTLYFSYLDVLEEICAQRRTQTNVLRISEGYDFPQGQIVDLLVNDMRVRGSFTEESFTVEAIVAKYNNIALGPRQTVLNDCGVKDNDESLRTFWITDRTTVLKGTYLLVTDKKDKYHIINVTEQNGLECKFELVQYQNDVGGGGRSQPNALFQSPVGVPNFVPTTFPFVEGPVPGINNAFNWMIGWMQNQWQYMLGNLPGSNVGVNAFYGNTFNPADYNIHNQWFTQFVTKGLQDVNALPLDKEEYFNFQRLQNVIINDRASPFLFFDAIHPRDVYTLIGADIKSIVECAAVPQESWLRKGIMFEEMPEAAEWFATPGDSVYSFSEPYEIYVANILPSEVFSIMAYRRDRDGQRFLDVVPPEYYTLNEAEDLGDLTVTSIKFHIPLSVIPGEQWEDEIYVSLRSQVGPNIVDILIYLIETYTDKEWDDDSFNLVREYLTDNDTEETKYPANFALFERQDILRILSEIAFQSRCTLLLINDVFYLKYLSREPEPVKTLSIADALAGSLSLTYAETENLVTKLVALWREDYLPTTEVKEYVVRHNINRYGLHEQEVDFFIYNIEELVKKSATFWAIRWANSWKRISFTTYLKHLDLDHGDCINFSYGSLVASTKAIIESFAYDPNNFELAITCWLPIKAGKSTRYEFAWPADQEIPYPLPSDDTGGRKWKLTVVKGDSDGT